MSPFVFAILSTILVIIFLVRIQLTQAINEKFTLSQEFQEKWITYGVIFLFAILIYVEMSMGGSSGFNIATKGFPAPSSDNSQPYSGIFDINFNIFNF